MKNTFVFATLYGQDTAVEADITSKLGVGETIQSIAIGTVSPLTNPAFTMAVQSGVNPIVQLLLSAGAADVTYGAQMVVTTTARVLNFTLAAVVASPQSYTPYTTAAPDAYMDLVDEVEAGRGAIGTAIFTFPPEVDPSGGFVIWELLDKEGVVYAGGNAFDYTIRDNGISKMAIAHAVVTVPTTVPPTADGQRYQLRYTLQLPVSNQAQFDPLSADMQQNTFFSYESIRVVGLNTVPLGTESVVEFQGTPCTLSVVTDKLYDNVTVTIFLDNTVLLPETAMAAPDRVANGYYYAGVIPTDAMPVTLVPYSVLWKMWSSANPGEVFSERADLYIINPTISSAINDVKAKINKARTTLYGSPDMLFPETTIMTWLRRAGDSFNGAYGQFTSFTFTNAKGIIREFWLLYAELFALESQYLAEGEKAFDFQGASISLNVDRTQYLDNGASKIQSRLDSELKPLKQNLIIKGQTKGDGSADPSALAPGAIGAVGITITPASMWGRYLPGYPAIR